MRGEASRIEYEIVNSGSAEYFDIADKVLRGGDFKLGALGDLFVEVSRDGGKKPVRSSFQSRD